VEHDYEVRSVKNVKGTGVMEEKKIWKGGQENTEATNGNGKMDGNNGQMRKKGNKWEEKRSKK
jgi:hypothetical protein